MRSFLLNILILACCIYPVQAQDTIITAYDENGDKTVYTALKRFITAAQPISYIAPVHINPQERILPLRFGEGQKGYIIEGWIDQSFTLLQGRSQMDHFSQTSRIAFRYAPALRMTKTIPAT